MSAGIVISGLLTSVDGTIRASLLLSVDRLYALIFRIHLTLIIVICELWTTLLQARSALSLIHWLSKYIERPRRLKTGAFPYSACVLSSTSLVWLRRCYSTD